MNNHKNIFTTIYEKCAWGNDNNPYYKGSSGFGSKLKFLEKFYIPFLHNFIALNKIQSISDLGCGDFQAGPKIYEDISNIKYTGYDIYENLINYNNHLFKHNNKYNFIHLDIFNQKESIIDAELFIIKDVLQHWSNYEIKIFLDYLTNNKKYKFILIINSHTDTYETGYKKYKNNEENLDISTGNFRTLSAQYSPLKEFNPIILLRYGNKEVFYECMGKWYPHEFEVSLIVNKF